MISEVISTWLVLFCTLSQEGWDRASRWVLFQPRWMEAFLQPLVHQRGSESSRPRKCNVSLLHYDERHCRARET